MTWEIRREIPLLIILPVQTLKYYMNDREILRETRMFEGTFKKIIYIRVLKLKFKMSQTIDKLIVEYIRSK